MKKYILLFIVIFSFFVFQNKFAGTYLGMTPVSNQQEIYTTRNLLLLNFSFIKKWLEITDYKTHNNYLPIQLLFQTAYGYIFLGLFTLSGYLIKPRKTWIPICIGIYIGIALLFTFL